MYGYCYALDSITKGMLEVDNHRPRGVRGQARPASRGVREKHRDTHIHNTQREAQHAHIRAHTYTHNNNRQAQHIHTYTVGRGWPALPLP